MDTQLAARPTRRPLRLWPGIVIALAVLLARYVAPAVVPRVPEVGMIGILVAAVGALLLLIWWLLFSRAPWKERLAAVALLAGALYATSWLVHPSIGTGAMGMLFYILAIPVVTIAFVAGAVVARGRPDGTRRLTMAAAVLAACGALTLLRTGGFDGNFDHDFAWRWAPTPEDRLLALEAAGPPVPATAPAAVTTERLPAAASPAATSVPAPAPAAAAAAPAVAAETPQTPAGGPPAAPRPTSGPPAAVAAASTAPAPPPAAVAVPATAEWPGFRGPRRDGIVSGVRIATDWSAAGPVAVWKRAIGPGWSSFAVRGDRIYTQEQRGDDEVIACYRLSTGEPVWMHRDKTRFWESNAGAGPRATPLVHGAHVYALGAKGRLTALDAATGARAWTRDAAADTKATLPMWGFAGSPSVVGDLLVVAVSGALAAYDVATGQPRWTATTKGEGYSSPQLATIHGVPQILFISGDGLTSLSPADGKTLWTHEWKGSPMVQPAVTADGDVLLSHNDSDGLRRLAVARGANGWSATERWTTRGLKPYFNDFVVHKGHAYGFDGAILSCVTLVDGARKWKGGRYGAGQLVLLADQDLLLVLSEEGEIALVRATPDGFTQLARVPGIDGKTWNHPVVVGDRLLVRNGEEMASFRLPLTAGASSPLQ
jgi:hypothetical protein